MKMKSKKQIKPSVTLHVTNNVLEDIVVLKRALNAPLKNDELETLANTYLANTGITCTITDKVINIPVKKLGWFKRCLNRIKNLFRRK